ncbi:Uncharacterised protein [Serratia quinivorans]|nr:Uncharacterised protein [Serratia quinivorans]
MNVTSLWRKMTQRKNCEPGLDLAFTYSTHGSYTVSVDKKTGTVTDA